MPTLQSYGSQRQIRMMQFNPEWLHFHETRLSLLAKLLPRKIQTARDGIVKKENQLMMLRFPCLFLVLTSQAPSQPQSNYTPCLYSLLSPSFSCFSLLFTSCTLPNIVLCGFSNVDMNIWLNI